MQNRKTSILMKLIAFILVASLVVPCSAMAATTEEIQPYASYYLDAYNTYICAMGNGRIEIWYEVMGTGDMDEIGVLSIYLYESSDNVNWKWVETFQHEDTDNMLLYDDWYQFAGVSYQGTAGKYYKAYVCIWAGKNGSGDTRYMWARSVRAT